MCLRVLIYLHGYSIPICTVLVFGHTVTELLHIKLYTKADGRIPVPETLVALIAATPSSSSSAPRQVTIREGPESPLYCRYAFFIHPLHLYLLRKFNSFVPSAVYNITCSSATQLN